MDLPSDASRVRGLADGSLMLAAIASLAMFAGTVLVQGTRYLNLDVSWYTYAATRIDIGACRLYVDCFVDTNPPLILWLTAAAIRLGQFVGLDPIAGVRVSVALVSLGSGALLYGVLDALLQRGRVLPFALASFYLAVVGFVSLGDYGQREHLVALLIAPYVASIPAAFRGGRLPPSLAVAAGALAGLAVAIKPHYALVPLACELWIVWRARSLRASFRPQALALGAVGAAYIAAVALWAPGYFALLPLIAQAYGAYQEPLADVLAPGRATVALIVLPLILATLAKTREDREAVLPFVLAAAACGLAYALQQAAFAYRAIPILAMGLFAAYYAGLRLLVSGPRHRLAGLCALACLLVMLVPVGGRLVLRHWDKVAAMWAQAAQTPTAPAQSGTVTIMPAVATGATENETAWLADAIRRYADNGKVGFLSTGIDPLFPAILYTDATLANRMPHLWPLPILTRGRAAGLSDADLAAIRGKLFTMVREDMSHPLPRLILEVRGRVQAVDADDFSPMAFLAADPALRALFAGYVEADRFVQGRREYVLYVPGARRTDAAAAAQR